MRIEPRFIRADLPPADPILRLSDISAIAEIVRAPPAPNFRQDAQPGVHVPAAA